MLHVWKQSPWTQKFPSWPCQPSSHVMFGRLLAFGTGRLDFERFTDTVLTLDFFLLLFIFWNAMYVYTYILMACGFGFIRPCYFTLPNAQILIDFYVVVVFPAETIHSVSGSCLHFLPVLWESSGFFARKAMFPSMDCFTFFPCFSLIIFWNI